ncbi:hypothetical protein FrCorBMG51_10550 [Protofrankia coriariae]|uniref:DUF433 domain-containing protein n=2 Tax=Protofrankia coriariae TaxID=1562887 RepID=A0ABR5F491_9ACTN|nr:hypothetical protein FrCorBMG51_10550 [Protofrankia coriariae]
MRHDAGMGITVLDREVYSMGEAARVLGVRPARLRGWIDGYSRGGSVYEPVIRPERTGEEAVTWGEFVEAGYLREYRIRHRVSLQRLRPVVQLLRERLGVPYPLAHARPYVANRELVLEVQDETGIDRDLAMVVIRNGQLVLAPGAAAFVEKVEFAPGDGEVLRIHPDDRSSPVVVDPLRSFGAPAVHGIRTENLYDLFAAGDSVAEIADGYNIAVSDVEAAIRYESRIKGQENAA